MLCLQDFRMNLTILQVCSVLGFFPFRICASRGTMEQETRIWKKLIYYINQLISTIHFIFAWYRLIQATREFEPGTGVHHFGCAVICTTIPLFTRVTFWVVYETDAKLFCCIFNQIMGHFSRNPKKPLTLRRVLNMSLQELLAITFGVELLGAIVLHLILYFWHPLAFNFIHSVFPASLREVVPVISLLLGAIVEFCAICIWLATPFLMVFTCVTFFKMSNERPNQDMEDFVKTRASGMTIEAIQQAVKNCREFQLRVQIYNSVMSTVIFAMKLTLLINTVLIFFIAINGARRGDTLIAGVFFILGFIVALVFPIAFNDTFRIPRKCANFKRVIRMTCQTLEREDLKLKEFTRTVDSIVEIGIKQGGFKVMERTSTPEFLDFVISKVVDLIITF